MFSSKGYLCQHALRSYTITTIVVHYRHCSRKNILKTLDFAICRLTESLKLVCMSLFLLILNDITKLCLVAGKSFMVKYCFS